MSAVEPRRKCRSRAGPMVCGSPRNVARRPRRRLEQPEVAVVVREERDLAHLGVVDEVVGRGKKRRSKKDKLCSAPWIPSPSTSVSLCYNSSVTE